ncbi:branched-chain amino acid transaminase [candidate division KSB1 bacterium]|nr:branched-chain amino acid transaminase [candidate division KSB1 bacterium]RQW02689.1 MAG: branched-chain amino acid transaminase [candidate division KSB1 bacterium]
MDTRDEQGKIWRNGNFIEWKDATIHVMSHVVHYGTCVFEGMRCYKTAQGSSIFRLSDHIRRLFDSAKIYRIPIPYTQEEIIKACKETIKVNGYESAYVRPIVFRGYNSLGVDPTKCPVEVVIGALNWGKYLGEEGVARGVDVRVSSWSRMAPNTMPTMAKAGSNYMSSQLIKLEAMADGYTEGIGLDVYGYLSEGSGENIFIIRDGAIYTPTLDSCILPGLTRDCIKAIAKELSIPIFETKIQREMLYIADEIFFTGTAAEVTPIRSVDRITIGSGSRGPITEKIQRRYFEYVNGERQDVYGWHDIIN